MVYYSDLVSTGQGGTPTIYFPYETQDSSQYGTYRSTPFFMNGSMFIMMSNHSTNSTTNTYSKAFRWNGVNWEEWPWTIATQGATNFVYFDIGEGHYLANSNYRDGDNNTYSTTSRWFKYNSQYNKWDEVGSIATNGARNVKYFVIGTDRYLAFANYRNDSNYQEGLLILKWDGNTFQSYQTIALDGNSGLDVYTIDGDTYLFATSFYNGDTYYLTSQLYKWDGSQFQAYQGIDTIGGRDVKMFSIGNDVFMAIVNRRDDSTFIKPVNIYKWDGSSFQFFQEINGLGAETVSVFTLNGVTHLCISQDYDGVSNYTVPSYIYQYNGSTFKRAFTINGTGISNIEFADVDDTHKFLVVSEFRDGTDYARKVRFFRMVTSLV